MLRVVARVTEDKYQVASGLPTFAKPPFTSAPPMPRLWYSGLTDSGARIAAWIAGRAVSIRTLENRMCPTVSRPITATSEMTGCAVGSTTNASTRSAIPAPSSSPNASPIRCRTAASSALDASRISIIGMEGQSQVQPPDCVRRAERIPDKLGAGLLGVLLLVRVLLVLLVRLVRLQEDLLLAVGDHGVGLAQEVGAEEGGVVAAAAHLLEHVDR